MAKITWSIEGDPTDPPKKKKIPIIGYRNPEGLWEMPDGTTYANPEPYVLKDEKYTAGSYPAVNGKIPQGRKYMMYAESNTPDGWVEYAEGGPIKPPKKAPTLYVNDPNDPRLKAYNDSLSLYNESTQNLSLQKQQQEKRVEDYNKTVHWYNTRTKGEVRHDVYIPKPNEIHSSWKKNGIAPVKFETYSGFIDPDFEDLGKIKMAQGQSQLPIFKKPEQEIVYQPQSVVNKQTNKKPVQPVELKAAEPTPAKKRVVKKDSTTYTNAAASDSALYSMAAKEGWKDGTYTTRWEATKAPEKIIPKAPQLTPLEPKQPNVAQSQFAQEELQPRYVEPVQKPPKAVNSYTAAGYPMVGDKKVPQGRVYSKGKWEIIED